MSRRMDRRQFVLTGAAAAGLGTLATEAAQGAGKGQGTSTAAGQGPTMMTPKSVKPVVIASANGNRYKNGGPMAGVETAFKLMTKGDDVLDALIAGVNLCELDPEDTSVGYGGLPNADGVVQLDSCCMHGPKKRAGGVACLEGVRTPSIVARMVMQMTDHHLIVGSGAKAVRAADGRQDRRRPEHRAVAAAVARIGNAASIRSTSSIRRSAPKPDSARAWRWSTKG